MPRIVSRTVSRSWIAGIVLVLSGQPGAGAETVVTIPAAANSPGRGGVHWKTTLELMNPSATSEVAVTIAFLPAGTDNRAAKETTVRVPAGKRVVVPDVVGTLLLGTGGGALRLRAPATFHASARTETGRAGALPVGVEIPGEGSERAGARGVVFPLANRPGAKGIRSNVGFFNPGLVPVSVGVALYGPRLEPLGEGTSVTLPPLGFSQLSDVFAILGAEALDVSQAGLEFQADGPVHGFGIVLSNETADATFVAANPGAFAVRGLGLKPVASVTRLPDATFKTGNFCRLNRIPSTGRLVLTFGTGDYSKVTGAGPCVDAGMGYGYKELTEDLVETGRSGMFRAYPNSCAAGDAASVVVGSDYYFLTGGPGGWSLTRYDLATFAKRAETAIPLTQGIEASNDQMLAYVDGRLDASGLLAPASNAEVDPYAGFGTFHRLFSLDLAPLGQEKLTEPAHINGSSMIFQDGTYHLVTSTAFWGDLVALRYDSAWKPLGRTFLASRGQWSQGALPDGDRFWVSWVDVSRKGTANIVLGAFDRDWNPVARVPVTRFSMSDLVQGGRPALLQLGKRLYVSYDVDAVNASTHEERKQWECRIAVYEIEEP